MSDVKIVISAQDKASTTFESVRRGLSGIGERAGAVSTMLSGIGATGALVGLVALVRQTADSIDKLNDLKDATGSSIENLSALENIALRNGNSFEAMAGSLVKFNKVLTESKPGSEMEKTLQAIGLNADELRKMDPADALLKTAQALAGYADDGNKARLIQDLFGKSIREAGPWLKDLAEAGKLNATVTSQQADEVERYNKTLAEAQTNVLNLTRYLTIDLVTGINAAAKAMKDGGLLEGFRTLMTGDDMHKANVSIVKLTELVLAAENALDKARAKGDAAQVTRLTTVVSMRRQELAAIQGYKNILEGPPAPQDKRPSAPTTGGKSSAAGKGTSDRPFSGLSYDEQITRKAGQLLEDSDLTKAREYADTLAKLDNLYFSGVINGELYDSAVKKLSKSTSEAGKEVDQLAEAEKRLAALMAASTGGQIEAQRQDMLLLAQAFEQGAISAEQFTDAASVRLGLKGPGAGEDPIAKRLSDGIEDGILSGFRNGKSISDVFLDELKAQFGKTILSPIIKPIAEFGSGLISGGLQSLATSLFGLPGHANGLSYVPYDNYVARLHKGERVLTAAENKAGGAGQTIHITMAPVIGNIASKDDVIKGMQAAVNQTLAKLQRAGAYGGSAA